MENEHQVARDPFYDLVPEKMWLRVTNIGVKAPGMIRVILEVNCQEKELYHGYVTDGTVSHEYNLTGWIKRGSITQQAEVRKPECMNGHSLSTWEDFCHECKRLADANRAEDGSDK